MDYRVYRCWRWWLIEIQPLSGDAWAHLTDVTPGRTVFRGDSAVISRKHWPDVHEQLTAAGFTVEVTSDQETEK
jgi:hypothetical protein